MTCRPHRVILLNQGSRSQAIHPLCLAHELFRYCVGLDEHLAPHESLKALLVELWLHSGQLLFTRPQKVCLNELLALLVAVPKLQEIDDRDMVGLHAVWTRKAMPFEPYKF